MKRLACIFILTCLLFGLAAAQSMAADECTLSRSGGNAAGYGPGLPIITLTCNGNSGTTTIPEGMLKASGWPRALYAVETIPGTGAAEPSAYTVAVANGNSTGMLSLSARSATAKENADASEDMGIFPPVSTTTLKVTLGDLGAGNTTTVNLIFWP